MDAGAAPTRLIAVVPNALSGLRLLLAAAFPLVPPGWLLPVVLAAGASDALDGVIARRFGATSVAGGLLDAVADKLFTLSVLLTLAARGEIGWWQVPIVLARDLVVAAVAAYAVHLREWGRFRRMTPLPSGKAATLLLFAWFVVLLVPDAASARVPVFAAAGATSVFAAGTYLVRFAHAWREWRSEKG